MGALAKRIDCCTMNKTLWILAAFLWLTLGCKAFAENAPGDSGPGGPGSGGDPDDLVSTDDGDFGAEDSDCEDCEPPASDCGVLIPSFTK